jgi:hypothetical protein
VTEQQSLDHESLSLVIEQPAFVHEQNSLDHKHSSLVIE